ncbi:MAG TPA: AAA family ATPase [Pirellulales bacterium]|nr:AAA family ATPase [Pirellulales bacterium]
MSLMTKFTVERFRQFDKPVAIALDPITVLIGANNSGKSAVLQGLALFQYCLEKCLTRNGKNGPNAPWSLKKTENVRPDEMGPLPVATPTDLWPQGRAKGAIRLSADFADGGTVTFLYTYQEPVSAGVLDKARQVNDVLKDAGLAALGGGGTVEFVCVGDRDYRTEAELKTEEKNLAGKAREQGFGFLFRLLLWRRVDIENYLIEVDALCAAASAEASRRGHSSAWTALEGEFRTFVVGQIAEQRQPYPTTSPISSKRSKPSPSRLPALQAAHPRANDGIRNDRPTPIDRIRVSAQAGVARPNESQPANTYLSAFAVLTGVAGSLGVAPGAGSNRFSPLPSMFVQNVPLPAWNNRSTSLSLNFWASE